MSSAKSLDQKRAAARRRRQKLAEVKRPVTKADGSTSLKSFYGPTKEAAEQAWRDYVNPIGQTVDGLADRLRKDTVPWWFVTQLYPLKAHLRDKTIDALETAARHLLPELQDVMIWDLTPTALVLALDRIAAKKTLRNVGARPRLVTRADGTTEIVEPTPIYKPLSASTVNKCRRLALEINQLAHEVMPGRVGRINPKRIPIRHEELLEIDTYSPVEMRQLLEAVRGKRAFVPVLLYGFLGLCLREGLGVQCQVLWPDGTLEVVTQDQDGELTNDLKTPYRKRDLALPEAIFKELQPFAFGRDLRLARGRSGQPLMARNVARDITAAMVRIGLRPQSPHKLRHGLSTWLDVNGCPRGVRLAILGQSRRAVADRYVHASPEDIRYWLGKFWDEGAAGAAKTADQKQKPRSMPVSKRNGRAVLTEEIVRNQVRPWLAEGRSPYWIGHQLGVSPRAIRQIKNGETWTWAA